MRIMNFIAVIAIAVCFTNCNDSTSAKDVGNSSEINDSAKKNSLSKETEPKDAPEIQPSRDEVLRFTNGSGKYELIISDKDVKIVYQYMNYDKMDPEKATLKNKKILVSKNMLAFEGQKIDEVYKIIGKELCVYNPENDQYDCYQFDRNVSTCDLDQIIK
jgi:hypothetical protein